MTILVDSDIMIEVLRGRNQEVLDRWNTLAAQEARVCYCPVTAAELWAGARPAESPQISDLFDSLECAVIAAEAGVKAGLYLRQFAKSHGVEIADALIAATASIHGAMIWTRNRKHYPMDDVAFF